MFPKGTSRETLGWKKHKLESRLLGEISITSDMQMIPPLWQKVKWSEVAKSCPTLWDLWTLAHRLLHPWDSLGKNTGVGCHFIEEQKNVVMKMKEENEKVGLKFNIQKTKVMASGPITSWEIDGETVETVADFIFGGSKITADGDCSHEIKRRLLLGRKVMSNVVAYSKAETLLCQQRSV